MKKYFSCEVIENQFIESMHNSFNSKHFNKKKTKTKNLFVNFKREM